MKFVCSYHGEAFGRSGRNLNLHIRRLIIWANEGGVCAIETEDKLQDFICGTTSYIFFKLPVLDQYCSISLILDQNDFLMNPSIKCLNKRRRLRWQGLRYGRVKVEKFDNSHPGGSLADLFLSYLLTDMQTDDDGHVDTLQQFWFEVYRRSCLKPVRGTIFDARSYSESWISSKRLPLSF